MDDSGPIEAQPTGSEAHDSPAEIGRREEQDRLAFKLHRLAGLETPTYSREDLLGMSDSDERLSRWWRAMGFPENPPNTLAFSQSDVELAGRLADATDSGIFSDDDIARLARLLGASFSRIAEAQISMIDDALAALPHSKDVRTPSDRMRALIESGDPELMAILEESMMYVWRRHFLAALGRWIGAEETGARQAVAFVDLVDFSKLSRDLTAVELAALVDQFERVSFDVVSSLGGRVVKLIGDEVMFVASTISVAAEIALCLKDALGAVDAMPEIRCGIAYGPTVNVGGDVFGGTVNLASRLAQSAKRGTVIVPRDQAEAISANDKIYLKRVRRKLGLKGIGSTSITQLAWADPSEADLGDELSEVDVGGVNPIESDHAALPSTGADEDVQTSVDENDQALSGRQSLSEVGE